MGFDRGAEQRNTAGPGRTKYLTGNQAQQQKAQQAYKEQQQLKIEREQQIQRAYQDGTEEYKAGQLPEDFHERVVDLEIKLEMKGVADDDQQLANISELMSLYSAAIEHYNRQ